jgi:hypothetical protein
MCFVAELDAGGATVPMSGGVLLCGLISHTSLASSVHSRQDTLEAPPYSCGNFSGTLVWRVIVQTSRRRYTHSSVVPWEPERSGCVGWVVQQHRPRLLWFVTVIKI